MTWPEYLEFIMEKHDLRNYSELAEKLETKQPVISDWILGKVNPRRSTIRKVEKLSGIIYKPKVEQSASISATTTVNATTIRPDKERQELIHKIFEYNTKNPLTPIAVIYKDEKDQLKQELMDDKLEQQINMEIDKKLFEIFNSINKLRIDAIYIEHEEHQRSMDYLRDKWSELQEHYIKLVSTTSELLAEDEIKNPHEIIDKIKQLRDMAFNLFKLMGQHTEKIKKNLDEIATTNDFKSFKITDIFK